MNAVQLLPAVRDLYSRQPEAFYLEPWELVALLWSLSYTSNLEDEGEITAAVEVAREDWSQWRRAA